MDIFAHGSNHAQELTQATTNSRAGVLFVVAAAVLIAAICFVLFAQRNNKKTGK